MACNQFTNARQAQKAVSWPVSGRAPSALHIPHQQLRTQQTWGVRATDHKLGDAQPPKQPSLPGQSQQTPPAARIPSPPAAEQQSQQQAASAGTPQHPAQPQQQQQPQPLPQAAALPRRQQQQQPVQAQILQAATRQQQPPQQQQQQQQQQHQQQQRQQQQKQQQQAVNPLAGLWQVLVGVLKKTPATLTAFLLGGFAACCLLFGWASGTPLRKHYPYNFTIGFAEASKITTGTPVRMKGVQIGTITKVTLKPAELEAVAEVCDASNIIPRGSRVDINLLGLGADPWIDITPPTGAYVRTDRGPHHSECARDGLIVCNNGRIQGSQGGSSDYMTKTFLKNQDRNRQKTVDIVYRSSQV
eukprot:GHRR01013016.1.p1 GENE.GHRR01013016.1~~GHRR01013016.1.p1  ORF type:complete len:358 (+),score=137.59 GHRR01013016.1:172-1245(+)